MTIVEGLISFAIGAVSAVFCIWFGGHLERRSAERAEWRRRGFLPDVDKVVAKAESISVEPERTERKRIFDTPDYFE